MFANATAKSVISLVRCWYFSTCLAHRVQTNHLPVLSAPDTRNVRNEIEIDVNNWAMAPPPPPHQKFASAIHVSNFDYSSAAPSIQFSSNWICKKNEAKTKRKQKHNNNRKQQTQKKMKHEARWIAHGISCVMPVYFSKLTNMRKSEIISFRVQCSMLANASVFHSILFQIGFHDHSRTLDVASKATITTGTGHRGIATTPWMAQLLCTNEMCKSSYLLLASPSPSSHVISWDAIDLHYYYYGLIYISCEVDMRIFLCALLCLRVIFCAADAIAIARRSSNKWRFKIHNLFAVFHCLKNPFNECEHIFVLRS